MRLTERRAAPKRSGRAPVVSEHAPSLQRSSSATGTTYARARGPNTRRCGLAIAYRRDSRSLADRCLLLCWGLPSGGNHFTRAFRRLGPASRRSEYRR